MVSLYYEGTEKHSQYFHDIKRNNNLTIQISTAIKEMWQKLQKNNITTLQNS